MAMMLNNSESDMMQAVDEVEHIPKEETRGLTRINSPYITKKAVKPNKGNAAALRFQHNLKERTMKEVNLRN